MSNPEFIAQQCDGCGGFLHGRHAYEYAVAPPDFATLYVNHSEAHRHARAAGWYLVEADLCPTCKEKQEVPDGD